VRESVVLAKLAEALQSKFLEPANLERLRAAIQRQSAQQGEKGQAAAEALRRKIARLDADIAKAKRNLILLDPEDIPEAKSRIREWERDRAAAALELKQTAKASPLLEVEAIIDQVRQLVDVVQK
jgi:hypothetical protein